jgi:hypothetical protein
MASLRLPFVMTVSVSAAAACGGNIFVHSDGNAGGGGAGGAPSGTTGVGGEPVSSSSSIGNPPFCPVDLVDGYTVCDLPSDAVCSYPVACQSGEVLLSFRCEDSFWHLEPQECDFPYDSCPATELYCDQTWWMPHGTNPPSPCPVTLPDNGTPCLPGGWGGDWEHCGYPCHGDPQSGWVVASCLAEAPEGPYSWQHDAGCPPVEP